MEFNRRNQNQERSRVRIPNRGQPRPSLSQPANQHPPATPAKPISKNGSASDRKLFGFDDIPVDDEDMEHVRFRDIIGAWIRQAIKHSPLEDKLKSTSTRTKRLNELKNDLKWAMQADLDEPVRPHKAPTPPAKSSAKSEDIKQKEGRADPNNSKTIDISISFGSLPKLPSLKKVYLSYLRPGLNKTWILLKTRKKWVLSISLIIAAGLIYSGASPLIARYTKSEQSSGTVRSENNTQAPEYPTLLPKNTTISELGGWKRVSPPDSNPVFAYTDKINDTIISVSQQPVPNSFKPNVADHVADLAKSFSAKNELDAGGTKVFIGTSSKGPQSAVLVKDDTLILIKAQAKISDSAWITYVQQLNQE